MKAPFIHRHPVCVPPVGQQGKTRVSAARFGAGILMVLLATPAHATFDLNQAEVVAAAGVAGILDAHRGTQTRLEYHFRVPLVRGLRPYLATGVAADSAYHFGAGLAYRRTFGARWRVLVGSGPAQYWRKSGFDLGHNMEFFSFAEIDRRLAPRHWLGLRVAHVSNASFGNRNPGREMLGLTYTRAWDRSRRQRAGDRFAGQIRPPSPR